MKTWTGVYTSGEGYTKNGQLVKFTCRPEDKEQIIAALELFRDLERPVTQQAKMVGHGGYGLYTRFDIIQHKYAGGHGGYIEALEIKDPPDGRCGFVVHNYIVGAGDEFYEFETLTAALTGYETYWSRLRTNAPGLEESSYERKLRENGGFLRRVACGPRLPWFYAVGDQHLQGDIVFPDCVMENPVYRFGRKFVLTDREGMPYIAECIGCYEEETRIDSWYNNQKIKRLVVFFEDGTIWREKDGVPRPIPLRGDQLWIHEAIQKFERLLAGRIKRFNLEFLDGSRFCGVWRFAPGKNPPGRYRLKLELEDGKITQGEHVFTASPGIRHSRKVHPCH